MVLSTLNARMARIARNIRRIRKMAAPLKPPTFWMISGRRKSTKLHTTIEKSRRNQWQKRTCSAADNVSVDLENLTSSYNPARCCIIIIRLVRGIFGMRLRLEIGPGNRLPFEHFPASTYTHLKCSSPRRRMSDATPTVWWRSPWHRYQEIRSPKLQSTNLERAQTLFNISKVFLFNLLSPLVLWRSKGCEPLF